jgi:hypothetical protein
MSLDLQRLAILAVVWMAVALFFWWGDLPARARRVIALAVSTAGLVFLVLGLRAAGERHTFFTGSLLLGPHYLSEVESASAGLRYYVMTAVCLLLGTVGLALPERMTQRIGSHMVQVAVGLSIFLTVVRFALEKAAAPESWIAAAGITWLPPLVGACFALRKEGQAWTWREVARDLFRYGILSRVFVALVYLAASGLQLRTHYDLSHALLRVDLPFTKRYFLLPPMSWRQLLGVVIIPQLVVWPLYTVVAGLVGGWMAVLLMGGKPSERPAREGVAGGEVGAGN